MGPSKVGEVIKEARDEADALKRFKAGSGSFLTPVVSLFDFCLKKWG